MIAKGQTPRNEVTRETVGAPLGRLLGFQATHTSAAPKASAALGV